MKHTPSRKAPVVHAPPPPPPPPPKYPNLTAVKDMFWDTWEDINRTSVNGKLNTRAVRNSVGDVLANGEFWWSLVSAVKRRVKVTNDQRKADNRIQICNALTSAITSPMAVDGFEKLANEVYDTVTRTHSKVGTDGLRLVTEMVNGGEVTKGLDAITNIVNNVNLDPEMLVKGFESLRKTLNLGGSMDIGGGLAKSLMSISSKLI